MQIKFKLNRRAKYLGQRSFRPNTQSTDWCLTIASYSAFGNATLSSRKSVNKYLYLYLYLYLYNRTPYVRLQNRVTDVRDLSL